MAKKELNIRKLMLVGRSEAGKTTLTQALRGENLRYEKTQAVDYSNILIDTPGEYIQSREFGAALALYAYESDIVGLLASATEPYSLFSPCITGMTTREVIGIVTKIDRPDANPDRAENWLRLAGCEKVFRVSSYTGEGIDELIEYLSKPDKNQQKTT